MTAPTAPADLDAARSALGSACAEIVDAAGTDTVDGVRPALVARPASTEEVAGVLRAAAAHGLAVVPRGRGTKMTWGRPPERADLVVDLSRLSGVVDHAAGDLIVEVRAGTPLAEVQEAVARGGQRLSLDDPVGGSTVGGALATNLSGPGRVAAGTARDLLIGVTLVRADGVVAKAGGRVVKNVAGYDLGKLVIGSFGTLGIVTGAVFRLHPLPAVRRFVSVPVESPDDALRLAQSVVHAQVVPAAVEVDWPATGPGRLDVLLEGTDAGVEARTTTTLRLLGGAAAESQAAPDGWSRFPWHGAPDRPLALKATCALSGMAGVIGAARRAAEEAGTTVALRGSAGAGVLYGTVPPDAPPAAAARLVDRVRGACTAAGGSLVVLDGPPATTAALDAWGPIPALDLMRRVKNQFDPERRLAPGRFVGGI
ncbi:MAG: glcE [Frankiales bacterium]|nr:glcE [Frankiales bacterium]